MCGINGYILNSEPTRSNLISLMNDEIIHRGPDDDGVHIDLICNKYIGYNKSVIVCLNTFDLI